MRQIKKLCV